MKIKKQWMRSWLIWAGIWIAVALAVARPMATPSRPVIGLSQVASEAREGRIERIAVEGDTLIIKRTDGSEVTSRKEPIVSVTEILRNYGVEQEVLGKMALEVRGPSAWDNWMGVAASLLPMLLLVGFLLWSARRGQQAMGHMFSFGQSRARQTQHSSVATFADVAGAEEAKTELQELVQFLMSPGKFEALGARIPRGALLIGPPGTGKTLLARAVAGEARVPFFSISGSEFVEMFVGVGASRVRDLFEQAKKNAPCIVFVDEIDAVGRHRGAGLGGGHDEREQTLNQILVEMDGFDQRTGIIVIAATNRPDVLDAALLRPGRFDRQVVIDLPDLNERQAILNVHARGKPLGRGISLATVARQTPGFSGADLANIMNEAAILAVRKGRQSIGMSELEEAVERVLAGPQHKGRLISPKEKKNSAYHEAGHALVARMLPNADPVHKISIVARGRMGGYTRLLPAEDHRLWTKSQFEDTLALLLGGQAAEELVFGEVTTGAANDIERASQVARDMVTKYGMSERLGPLAFGRREELVFLGRELPERRNYSEETAREIDEEVKALVERAKDRARQILAEYEVKLKQVAEALIERETLEAREFEAILSQPEPVGKTRQESRKVRASESRSLPLPVAGIGSIAPEVNVPSQSPG